jgi:hypothetical protein
MHSYKKVKVYPLSRKKTPCFSRFPAPGGPAGYFVTENDTKCNFLETDCAQKVASKVF